MSEKLDFNDILIVPSVQTNIQSRAEINPYYKFFKGEHLPLISAPMDTVVSKKNSKYFMVQGINICYPRNEKKTSEFRNMTSCLQFDSISLKEFRTLIQNSNELKFNYNAKYYVCIDIANGHMIELCNAIKEAKEKFGDKIVIMAGNIANSDSYYTLSDAGADFIRCGIGNGGACTTTANVAIGYPMASLIKECYKASQFRKENIRAKIVADGGMKSYSDIIKALALGADYVMIGSMFNKCLESCAKTYFKGFKINQDSKIAEWLFEHNFKLTKKYRGMSTKEVQKDWGKAKLTTSEGISKKQNVEYKLDSWTENFVDYLKSAMSYSDAKNLNEFIGKAKTVEISNQAFNRFNK